MGKTKKNKGRFVSLPFKMGKKNLIIMGSGVLSVLLGYITLAKGMVDLPAILLVLGYCVLLPVGIIWKEEE